MIRIIWRALCTFTALFVLLMALHWSGARGNAFTEANWGKEEALTERTFEGGHQTENGHRFFVLHVTQPIRDFDAPGFYWWHTDDAGNLVKGGPYPTAERAYLAATGN